MRSFRKQCLVATVGAAAIWGSPALAQEQGQPSVPGATQEGSPNKRSETYVDLTASLGYATNPFLDFADDSGSGFGRLSARGVQTWAGETGYTSISGFVEGSTYFNDYGLESIFSVNANTQQKVSEKVTVFGSAGFSGDLSGQLSNRFLYTPPTPQIPDPTIPPPPTVTDPDVFTFTGRQYTLYGQAGASIQTSERGSVSISGGAQRIMYTSDLLNDYTTVFGDVSYNHSLSPRTTVGFGVNADYTNYDNSSDHSSIIDPTITIRTQLSEYWDLSAGVGVSFSNSERLGSSDNATNLSLNASACHSSENERLCFRADRYAQSASRAVLTTTTSAGVDWYKKLDDKQTLQVNLSVVHYNSDSQIVDNFNSNYFNFAASYSRFVNDRISVGADIGARALRQDGPDPDTDFSGSVFVRYRLGDRG